jgi:hypothetical protein
LAKRSFTGCKPRPKNHSPILRSCFENAIRLADGSRQIVSLIRLNAAGLAEVRHVVGTPLSMLELLLGNQAALIQQFSQGVTLKAVKIRAGTLLFCNSARKRQLGLGARPQGQVFAHHIDNHRHQHHDHADPDTPVAMRVCPVGRRGT